MLNKLDYNTSERWRTKKWRRKIEEKETGGFSGRSRWVEYERRLSEQEKKKTNSISLEFSYRHRMTVF